MAAEKAEIDALKKECDGLRTKIEVKHTQHLMPTLVVPFIFLMHSLSRVT